jgi:biotin carboxylase
MLWVVGKVSKDFKQYLHEHQIPYGCLSDTAPRDNIPFIPIDFSTRQSVQDSLLQANMNAVISALLVTGYEKYVLPAAWISSILNLPGLSVESAKAATDKSVMRHEFSKKTPHHSPEFKQVHSWVEIEKFAEAHDYPLMLKPTNLMKSLYVTKNSSLEELKANYHYVSTELPNIKKKYPFLPQTKLIIEEFLSGSMHTVAGFVDAAGSNCQVSGAITSMQSPGKILVQPNPDIGQRQLLC